MVLLLLIINILALIFVWCMILVPLVMPLLPLAYKPFIWDKKDNVILLPSKSRKSTCYLVDDLEIYAKVNGMKEKEILSVRIRNSMYDVLGRYRRYITKIYDLDGKCIDPRTIKEWKPKNCTWSELVRYHTISSS